MRRAILLALAGLLLSSGAVPTHALGKRAIHDLPPLDTFHYQLQNLNVAEAAASPFPLLVTDYSLDGSAAGKLTPAQVAQLQTGGRIVLAYLSIGEAEDYRYYWNPAWTAQGPATPGRPAWLGPENPQWPGNFKVRYWDPAWQALIFGSPSAYLDQILAQGFDGVYLDIVDGYEFWGPDGNNERPSAAADMTAFVTALANYARARVPSFAVVPQNAAALVADAGYLNVISGIGAEDTWYNGNRRQRLSDTREVLSFLRTVRDAGKPVLVIDYPRRRRAIDDFFNKAEAMGFAAYQSDRALDRMTIHPLHPPSAAPAVALDTPADGATAGRSAPPTFTWSASGAAGYRLQFSGTPELRRIRQTPRGRGMRRLLSVARYTPSAREWRRLVRLARAGDGRTLYWWVIAYGASGAKRSARLRRLTLSGP